MYKETFPSGIEALDALSLILNSKHANKDVAQYLRRHMSDFEVTRLILTNDPTIALAQPADALVNKDVVRHLTQIATYFHCRIGEIDEAEDVYLILQTLITHLMIAMKRSRHIPITMLQ